MKILPLISAFLLLFCVGSQVIGIDFGTAYWKASLISPGKNLVIVQNSRSGRKSNNGIAFLDGVRYFEYDALTKRQKKPKLSYFYLNKLIESLDFEKPLEGYHFENGTYWFKEGEDTISLEQLVAMILKNVKKYSSQQAGSDIKDSVLTVPAHWGFNAKYSLINAASLAQLSVLGLINQNSAAAVHFAITRNDSDPVNVGFFNMGSHNLQISIVQFFGTVDPVREKNIQSMRVLSHVSVSNFGGLNFDLLLAQHVAAEFKKKHNIDVHQNLKSWTKLLHKSADLKQTLSANKQANIYIEGLIDGIDLNINVKRDVLEQSPLFSQLQGHLQQALDKAEVKKQDLQAVEVIGGNSRIPLIGKILKQFFDPVEVGSHINGDQSMAFGAALRAANLSIAFRVKQLHFYDGNPEQVRAVFTNVEDGVLNESALFDRNSEQGLRKEVVLDENENDVRVSVYYGEDVVHEYLLANVSMWKEKYNRSVLNFTEEPKLVLVFVAHSFNFAQLKEAYINITLNTTSVKETVELVVENVTIEEKQEQTDKEEAKQQKAQAEKDEEAKQQKAQAEKDEEAEKKSAEEEQKKPETEGEDEKEESEEAKSQKSEGQASEKKEKKKRTRQRTKSVKKLVEEHKIQNKKQILKITHQSSKYHRFTKEELDKNREVIFKYQKHEKYLNQKSKIRNDFQSTLYSLKEDFQNPGLKTFSKEEELQKLKAAVTEEIAWMDENSWTAEKNEFEQHFKSVQDIYYPIVNRSNQYRDREKWYNKTVEVMSLVYQKTVELNASQPWVQEKALAHLKKINDTMEDIHEKLKRQIDMKPNEDVIFYNHQMLSKAEDLRDEYYLIKMIPRPKTPKKKPVETPKEPQAEENLDLGDEEKPKEEETPEEKVEEPEPKEDQAQQSKQEPADGDNREDSSKQDL